jgi:hypothetical protein
MKEFESVEKEKKPHYHKYVPLSETQEMSLRVFCAQRGLKMHEAISQGLIELGAIQPEEPKGEAIKIINPKVAKTPHESPHEDLKEQKECKKPKAIEKDAQGNVIVSDDI